MAALAEADRVACWGKMMRESSSTLALTKPDLRAAVDAIDSWVESNQAAFNNAIPQPARGALTTKQKAGLLMIVVSRRYEVQ